MEHLRLFSFQIDWVALWYRRILVNFKLFELLWSRLWSGNMDLPYWALLQVATRVTIAIRESYNLDANSTDLVKHWNQSPPTLGVKCCIGQQHFCIVTTSLHLLLFIVDRDYPWLLRLVNPTLTVPAQAASTEALRWPIHPQSQACPTSPTLSLCIVPAPQCSPDRLALNGPWWW